MDVILNVSHFSVGGLHFEAIANNNVEKYTILVEIATGKPIRCVLKKIEKYRYRLFAVKHENHGLIGTIGFWRFRKWLYEIKNLYVLEGERNKGYGAKIVSAMVDLIRGVTDCEHAVILASVKTTNMPSIRVFEKNGFTRLTTVRVLESAYVFQKVVKTVDYTDLTKVGFEYLRLSDGKILIENGMAKINVR